MQLILALMLLVTFSCGHQVQTTQNKNAATQKLTLERLFADPSLSGSTPRGLKFSPDGKRVTFLRPKDISKGEDKNILDLWEYHIPTQTKQKLVDSQELLQGKSEKLTEAEKATRERKRISSQGIVEYYWDKQGEALIFPLNGDIYHYQLANKKLRQLTKTPSAEMDIEFSPQGKFISFVRDQNLYVINLKSGLEHAITTQGKGTITYGQAEFIAQEEMERYQGYWWSPDEKWLAFTRVDESPIPLTKRYEIDANNVQVIDQRYPYTGGPNAKVELFIVGLNTQGTIINPASKIPLSSKMEYLPRVKWHPKSDRLSYQEESRDQKTLTLSLYNPQTKASKILLTETNTHWINLHKDLNFLKKSEHFLWSSERSGFKQLYLYDMDGTVVRQITQGDWDLGDLLAVDEAKGLVYFSASLDQVLEDHLYQLSYTKNETPKKITQAEGTHRITIDETKHFYLDAFSNHTTPPQVALYKIDGSKLYDIEPNALNEQHPLTPYQAGFAQQFFEHSNLSDGTKIYYGRLSPQSMKPARGYPTFVWIYGGPSSQDVTKAWDRNGLWFQLLAQKGIQVICIDNRGTINRGRAFANPIYHRLGKVESDDYNHVIQDLIKQNQVDPGKVMIAGWSYGGFMSLMSVGHHPNTFKSAIAVAPVTDWSLYDTFYTEKYLGTPKENPQGYEQSSVLKQLKGVHNPLLIIHGMADDNVLFSNSTLLYKTLQEQGTIFETMVYPGSKHGIYGKANQLHVYKTMTNFIERMLIE